MAHLATVEVPSWRMPTRNGTSVEDPVVVVVVAGGGQRHAKCGGNQDLLASCYPKAKVSKLLLTGGVPPICGPALHPHTSPNRQGSRNERQSFFEP